MKGRSCRKLSLAILSLAVITAAPKAVGRQDSPAGRDFTSLTLEIAAPQKEIVPLQPLPLTLRLSNGTDRPLFGHALINFSRHLVELLVSREGSEPRRLTWLTHVLACGGEQPRVIQPGEDFQTRELLYLDLDKVFPAPGTYRLQFALKDLDRRAEVRSNVVTVVVAQPKGVDREAYEYLMARGNPSRFLLGSWLFSHPERQGLMEEFVRRFSGSAYGDHASYVLALYYDSKGEKEKAGELFGELAKRADLYYARSATEHRARINTVK